MKEKGTGGGNTITGLNFEKEIDIIKLLRSKKGYKVDGNIIYYEKRKLLGVLEKMLFTFILNLKE